MGDPEHLSKFSFGSSDFDGDLTAQAEFEDAAVAAAKRGDVDAIRQMLLRNRRVSDLSDPKDRSTLHHAASSGSVALINLLVANGSNVNAQDLDGNPPIFYAIQNGRLEAVKLLLDLKADVKLTNTKALSALHMACHVGNPELIALIIDQPGVDINAVDCNRKSSLHVAAYRCTPEAVDMLIKHGASLDIHDVRGNSPYDLANRLGKDRNSELLRTGEEKDYVRKPLVGKTPSLPLATPPPPAPAPPH